MPDDILDQAEKLKRLIVDPMVERVRDELHDVIKPVVERHRVLEEEQKAQRAELDEIKSKQNKAMVGWGVFATGLSLVLTSAGGWIKERIGL